MTSLSKEGQILFTGITVNDLLLQIGQIIDAKLGNLPLKENNQSEYLSRKEVAKLLKITLPTLHDWTKQGWLKAYKMGTRVLYKQTEIEASLHQLYQFKHRKGGMNHAQV